MMAEAAQALAGPNLRDGVPLAELREHEPFSGQVEGEPVVLVRRQDEVYAVGGTCTHYGGPLGEGLVSGNLIRCPWHHACFDLRTGAAVAAPALNPLPRWRTEVRDGRVFVLDKQQDAPLDPHGRSLPGPESVVIVGAGAAGSAAAEMLRSEGYQGPVVLIDPDADAPYDRPNLSKDYLAGRAPEDWIPLRPQGFYAAHAIERKIAAVSAIDTTLRRVTLSDGSSQSYGALLLATGAAPIRLPLRGADLPNVHVLRSLGDCRALIQEAGTARRAVIAGASFIAMEAASALGARGLEVTVVAPEAVPFARTLGAELGAFLRSLHESNGVRFQLGRTLREIRPDRVVLDEGSEIEADLVLLGVGVRPVLQLAEAAGLNVDDGIVVDEYLQTSVPDVYAAGDVARYPDAASGQSIRIEHWVVAQRQGQTAARNLLGQRQAFASVPFFWTQQYDVSISYVGHASAWEEAVVKGDPSLRDCRVEYVTGGELLALATIGRDQESLRTEAELERRNRVRPSRAAAHVEGITQ
jgi:NADPH-dependent 2,4-dienoyl-CoA reductase/sulfur reductase-like enzyme/nitrite reductase/ring-hydroxylating ferredoxin subunit